MVEMVQGHCKETKLEFDAIRRKLKSDKDINLIKPQGLISKIEHKTFAFNYDKQAEDMRDSMNLLPFGHKYAAVKRNEFE